jgi:tetrahydromethanopterin S-methyltransferase subunit D
MRRFALVVMPILAAVTVLIGLYFIYVGGRTVMMGRYVGIGLGFAGFGAVGLVLAYALWSVRRQILARLVEPGREDGRS